MATAQWTQLGPGAGGQERALYIYHKSTTDNDVYVGSDVSGVWRAPAISDADLNNPNSYNYTYISNHRIFRFMNKFYRADEGTNNYLFCLNRGGIDRIELDNAGNMTAVNVLASGVPIAGLNNSWVSDMHVTASNGQTYFITGNTRTSDPGPGNNKANSVQEIYMGNIPTGYTTINTTNEKRLYGLPNSSDVYCLFVDDNNDANETNDLIFVGAQNGLHVFTYTQLISGNPLPASTKMNDPTNITFNDYRLTSLRLISHAGTDYTFLATINGLNNGTGFGGLYTVVYHNNGTNTATWQKYSNTLLGEDANLNTAQYNNPHFNQTLEVPGGYLVFNETNLEHLPLVTDPNYFVGAFYFPASSGIPTGASTVLTTWGTANDWGWNNSKPCSNINGCTITNNGLLLVGKSGNIFASKAPVSGASVDWQQIYTTETALTSCTGKFEYANHGYVNTANKTVFPQTEDDVWLGQADRLIWNSTNGASTFTEVKLNNNINPPCIYEIDTTNVQNLDLPVEVEGREYNFSDCFFVAENNADPNDNFLYASMSSGFASNIGRGAVVRRQKNDPVSTRWVPYGSNLLAGDASKMLFDNNGNHFLLVNQIQTAGPALKKLYWLNTNNLWEETTMNLAPATQLVDAVMAPDGDKLFIILNVAGTLKFEVWNGSNNIWISSCSYTVGGNQNLTPKILSLLPYGPENQYYKILCGTAPNSLTVLDNNLYEVYDSQNPTICASTPVTSTLPDIFIKLNNDLLDNTDEGITAIDVNAITHTIYVATVHYDNTLTPEVKSHLYAGTYNFYDGIINTGSWTDITGTLPNKTLTSLNTHGSNGCNAYLFGCLRGLGPWKLDLQVPTTFNQNYFDNNPLITGTGYITENIVINAITNLNAANINIEAGYTITVNSGGVLNIYNGSHLYSCGNMWQGIINNGGTVNITNSTIEDAINIVANNGGGTGKLTATNSTFDHNYVGLSFNAANFGTSSITGCTFKCTGGQITKAPYNGQQTRYHISLSAVDGLTIGNSTLTKNTFQNASKAIFATNSNVEIINNQFEWIPNNLNTWGEAIYIDGKHTISTIRKIGGSANANDKNTFINWKHNIIVNNAGKILIENNVINPLAANRSFVGISQQKCTDVTIKGNAINRSNNGLMLFDNAGATVSVTQNTFNKNFLYDFAKYDDEAIRFENNLYLKTKIYTITSNQIYNVAIGIHGNNTNAIINYNTYHTDITTSDLNTYTTTHNSIAHRGIWVQNATGTSIVANTIDWAGTVTLVQLPQLQGIRVQGSFGCNLQENIIKHIGAGIDIFDDCSKSTLYCNLMERCYNGVYFDINSVNNKLTDQGIWNGLTGVSWYNRWDNNVATNHIDGNFTQTIPMIWTFVGASDNPNPQPFLAQYFQTIQVGSILGLCTQPEPLMSEADRNALFGAAIGDSSTTVYDSLEYANSDKTTFYVLATDDSTVLYLGTASDAKYQAEYDSITETNIGKFENAKTLLIADAKQLAMQKLASMQDHNAIDQNKIFMGTLLAIGYDPALDADSDTIPLVMNIAMQHPFYGGEAVYIARAMLHVNVEDVLPPLRRKKATFGTLQNENLRIKIYPNPAKNIATIISNTEFENGTKLIFQNAMGSTIQTIELPINQKEYTIDINELADGIYFVKLSTAHGESMVEKLVILK